MQSRFPVAFPFCMEKDIEVEVKSGKTAVEKVALIPAVHIRGRVADKATLKGISGVGLILIDGLSMRYVVTNARGEYTFYSRTGDVGIFVSHAPDPYVAPSSSVRVIWDDTSAVKSPDILLDSTSSFEALVVDAAGRPIERAEVRIAANDSEDEAFKTVLHSDAAGRVILGDFSTKQTLAIRGRSNNAAAAMKKVPLGSQKGPIRLVLSEKTAFVLRGTMLDDAGLPILQADLKLFPDEPAPTNYQEWCSLQSYRMGNFSVAESKSDAEGKFEFAGLWPDIRYRLFLKAPGHERYASAIIHAHADKTCDLGKIVLARTVEVVEGTVIDSVGKPVAGARVFNSGDGPEPMETRSDAGGRFRLEGFRKGPAYVFAIKDGYQFAGLRTTAGAKDAAIKMFRNGEATPKRSLATTTFPPEEQKKLAREVLEKAWDTLKHKKKSVVSEIGRALLQGMYGSDDMSVVQRESVITLMEKVDPDQAKRWKAELPAKSASKKRMTTDEENENPAANAIQQVAEEDIDKAMSLLDKDAEQSIRLLRVLTDHFAEKDHDKALRCAEKAIVRARSLDQPNRTMELARWGQTVLELGNKEAGRKLLDEAADTADRWKTDSLRYDEACGVVAESIAPYNAGRAIAILKIISDDKYRQDYRMRVAVALEDIKQVEALLKGQNPETIKTNRMCWASRTAATRPADAVRGMETQLKQDEAEGESVHFAKLAERIGTRDMALARRLIDRGLAALFSEHAVLTDEMMLNGAAKAARLAVIARKVDRADMEDVVLRVLALRQTPGKDDSPLPILEADVRTARILALTDAAAARHILQTIEPSTETLENRREWLQAWALADPRHGAELAEKELARCKSGALIADSLDAVLAAVRLWTDTADERIQEILPDFGKTEEYSSGIRQTLSRDYERVRS
jgi:hypothetical protein